LLNENYFPDLFPLTQNITVDLKTCGCNIKVGHMGYKGGNKISLAKVRVKDLSLFNVILLAQTKFHLYLLFDKSIFGKSVLTAKYGDEILIRGGNRLGRVRLCKTY